MLYPDTDGPFLKFGPFITGGGGTASAQTFTQVLQGMQSPNSVLLRLNEPLNSTTFADSSGNGNTGSAVGTIFCGSQSIVPNEPAVSTVNFIGLGHITLATSAQLDITAPTAFNYCLVLSNGTDNDLPLCVAIGKTNAAGSLGYHILFNGSLLFRLGAANGNNRVVTYAPPPYAGKAVYFLSFDGNPDHTPYVTLNGVSVNPTGTSGSGVLDSLSNTAKFTVGGYDGGGGSNLQYTNCMQAASFVIGPAWTPAQHTALYAAYASVNYNNAIAMCSDTDGGSGDTDDWMEMAYMVDLYKTGKADPSKSGSCTTVGDDWTAAADNYVLNTYYGLNLRIGAYQGTDMPIGNPLTSTSKMVRDQFCPGQTRALFTDSTTYYSQLCSAAAPGSLVFEVGGCSGSIGSFLAASGANVTSWNAAIKYPCLIAGQWPNSPSSGVTPVGNFITPGAGEFNLSAALVVGATDAALIVSSTTSGQLLLCGVEMVGSVGSDPALALFISSQVPPSWPATNPIAFAVAGGSRAAWGQLGAAFTYNWARYGAGNPYCKRVQINAPSISTTLVTVGQNTSTPGSSNAFYFVPNLDTVNIAAWRTIMKEVLNSWMPTVS